MDQLHLHIYGEIGSGLFEDGSNTAEKIQKDLVEHPEAKEVIVHISSPGGAVFEGWTIGNILKNSGKKTTAQIEGLCASIATFIALSCDRVEMAETAMFIIHNPVVGIEGEEEDLESAADQLAKIKDDLIKIYREKTGKSINQISAMMDNETSMNASEAKAEGFVDGFMTPLKAVAKFDIKNNKMEKLEDAKTNKLESLLDRLIARTEKFLKIKFPKSDAHDITVELEDGSFLFIESEDGELEGKSVWMVDEEGNKTETPAPDGTFKLNDGRSITVEAGVVVSVQEEEEIDKLKVQIEKLEAEAKESEKNKKSLDEKVKEGESQLTETLSEIKNLKKLTVGSTGHTVKAIIDPGGGSKEPETHRMDSFANSLKIVKRAS